MDDHTETNHIVCDVEHCVFHGKDDCCHAREVHVGPHEADKIEETACITFQEK